jgi:hypothetical protein
VYKLPVLQHWHFLILILQLLYYWLYLYFFCCKSFSFDVSKYCSKSVMPYFTKRLGNICKENRLMNSQWLNSYFFACLLIIFVPKSYILVIYTLYSMITMAILWVYLPRYSTTDLGFQRLLAKRPTVSPIVIS